MNRRDQGRASLEFLTAAVFVLIPLMMLGLSLSSIQNATLAAETAARQGVRVFVQDTTLVSAARNTEWAIRLALDNFGIADPVLLERRCIPQSCLSPGSVVTLRVGVRAPLFGTALLPALDRAGVTVFAEATAVVSPYGGTP